MGLFWWRKNRLPAVVRRPAVHRVYTHGPAPGLIAVDETALWRRQGWTQTGNRYDGWYRTRFGAWQGRIERRGDIFKPIIFDPPLDELRLHSRWDCFRRVRGNWWRIHLAINPAGQDVDSVLFNVERILDESFARS